MQTAAKYLDDLAEAVALRVDGHLVAALTNKVRVEILIKDQEIEYLHQEIDRLKKEQHH